jgi:MFS family permease
MIEAYAFLAVFTIQILVMSVLVPAWFIRYVRVQATSIAAERLAQLYPDVDLGHAQARFLAQYRALTTAVAVFGVLLLGWLFNYMQRPDWGDSTVVALVTVHFIAAQVLPLLLFLWVAARFNKEHQRSLEGKRTAVLKRRGLFDFVSPVAVFLAVLSYVLFAAFVLYIRQHPFPGFAGFVNLGVITLIYALNAFSVYTMLYGRNKNPFETHAVRLHTIGLAVKGSVYSCIISVVYLSLNFSLRLLDLKRWEPFSLSVFFVICALVASMGFAAPLRKPEADELRADPAP